MRADEFPAYCEYFIDDYSREIVDNYGHSLEVAIDLAKKELAHSFPNGYDDNEQSLLCIDTCIDEVECLVGYLWHCINLSDESTFICDFFIDPKYRGKGLGKQTMLVLERQLACAGVTQIKLRVAYQNQRALKLYQQVGFTITGINMSKKIGN
jgi:ribosomal protein S18 acetylase RimI-like enzyme